MNENENPTYQKSGMHLNQCLESYSQHQAFTLEKKKGLKSVT